LSLEKLHEEILTKIIQRAKTKGEGGESKEEVRLEDQVDSLEESTLDAWLVKRTQSKKKKRK